MWNSARYVQTQCMMCTTQSSKSTGVLVVHGELLVVRVVPVVVCDDAVVLRTLVFIAFTVVIVFVVAILRWILLYWRCSVYTLCRGDLFLRILAGCEQSSSQ